MNIILTHVPVDNQDKALDFYTNKLGFIKKNDFPMGGDARWLTVVSPNNQNGVELLLEPNWNPAISINGEPAARAYQKILSDANIPAAVFGVDDVEAEYQRLGKLGVVFKKAPVVMGPVKLAVLDDTCGNLIQMIQMLA
jgi:catechol 2,3-dioxygenase-like lactoylglutathione lyase family enzyme